MIRRYALVFYDKVFVFCVHAQARSHKPGRFINLLLMPILGARRFESSQRYLLLYKPSKPVRKTQEERIYIYIFFDQVIHFGNIPSPRSIARLIIMPYSHMTLQGELTKHVPVCYLLTFLAAFCCGLDWCYHRAGSGLRARRIGLQLQPLP